MNTRLFVGAGPFGGPWRAGTRAESVDPGLLQLDESLRTGILLSARDEVARRIHAMADCGDKPFRLTSTTSGAG